MVRKHGVLILIAAVVLLGTGIAYSGEPQKGDADTSTAHKTRVLVPSSAETVAAMTRSVDAKQLASNIGTGGASLYGFTTGVSKEKGSFKLGVLLTDVNVAMLANDREKALKALGSLVEGLVSLGAPNELVKSLMNVNAATATAADCSVIAKAVIPAIQPFVEKFVTDEGKLEYLQLGEWCQATKLAASVATSENLNVFSAILAQPQVAKFFSDAFANSDAVPPGAKAALQDLAKARAEGIKDLKGVNGIKSSIDDIIKMMS